MFKKMFAIAAVVIAISASAFTVFNKSEAPERRSTQWIFTASIDNNLKNAANYSQSASEPSGCGLGETIPCTVDFPAGVEDQTALSKHLSNSSVTESTIRSMAVSFRD